MARIPSLQALRALESFSRHGTVWQAADELNLTRSAISHQLRGLEADLPFPVLQRNGTRVELTPYGGRYAEDVAMALRLLAGSAARNADGNVIGPLTVSCEPSFASTWLCSRIRRFVEQHRDLRLNIVVPEKNGSLKRQNVDLFITFGRGDAPGLTFFPIAKVVSSPMCSPAFLNEMGGSLPVDKLPRLPLLHLSDYGDWTAWFELSGLPPEAAEQGITFSDMQLVYAAAMAGQGIALGDIGLARDLLVDGQLIRPFSQTIRDPRSYYCAVPDNLIEKPTVIAFMNWLRLEGLLGDDDPHQSTLR